LPKRRNIADLRKSAVLSKTALAGPAVFVSLSVSDRLAVIGDRDVVPITDHCEADHCGASRRTGL
jgi:hypothetical protein